MAKGNTYAAKLQAQKKAGEALKAEIEARIEAEVDARYRAEAEVLCQWIAQTWADAFQIVTGDPAIMGHDTFGPERSRKVLSAIEDMANYIRLGITGRDDAEAVMEQTDRALRQRFGDKFIPATERYAGWEWKEAGK